MTWTGSGLAVSPGHRMWVRSNIRPGVVLSVECAAWREFVKAVKEERWSS